MSGGGLSAYFYPQFELWEATRDCPGRPDPSPFWTVPHSPPTDWSNELDSMYARPPYVGGGAMTHEVDAGMASRPAILRPPPCAEVRSARVHLRAQAAAAVPFPGPTTVHQFDRPRPACCVGLALSGNPQSLDAPTRDIAKLPALDFMPENSPWDEMVRIGFAPRASPLFPPQVRAWEPSEPTRIRPDFLIGNDTSFVEPASRQNTEDEDDVVTFLCEWTDEHGTCNMVVFGDRVWMSHHLSRWHNVVGHEKSQRACSWRGCTETMNKGSLARHVVSRHLRAGASCGFCSKMYSRADVARRHAKKCKVANATVERNLTWW